MPRHSTCISFLTCLVGLLLSSLPWAVDGATDSNNFVFIPIAQQAGPPRTLIAYSEGFAYSQKYLKTVLPDGSQQKQLLELPPYVIYSPAWSPDGKRLALSVGGSYIYIANTDGSGLTRIVDLNQTVAITPAWSPDGRAIVFASSYGGGSPPRAQTYLYVVQADGTQLRQLTRSARKDIDWGDTNPSWSPDSRSIIFQRRQGESNRLYRLDLATGQTSELPGPPGCLMDPAWSPDGQLIAFGVGCGVTEQNTYTMRPDGSNLRQWTFNREGGSPSWSPDGQWIALTDTSYISILGLANGQLRQLQLNQGTHTTPAWAPYPQ